MIKELFLPEKFGEHRLIAQRIVGIAVHDDMVRAVLVHAKKNKALVEQCFAMPIPPGTSDTHSERTVAVLREVMAQFKNYHQIRVTIPASVVIFKELALQFSDPEKIRMVLDYEVETMLPFSIDEAIIDFVVTKTNKETSVTDVLVAAVHNQYLQDNLSLFQQAGIEPTCVSIDLFAVHGLFQQIPAYNDLVQATALVEFGQEATRVAFIQQGQLKLTRYIQRGVANIFKTISEETHVEIADLEKKLSVSGIQNETDENLRRAIQKHFIMLFNDIQFTLNSFSLKLNFYEGVSKILFTGAMSKVKDFAAFFSGTMQIPAEIFDVEKIFLHSNIKNKTKDKSINWQDFVVALGTAIPSQQQGSFNLRRKQFAIYRDSLIAKQLITASVIILLMFLTIGIKGYIDIKKLSNQVTSFESYEISRFKAEKIFPRGKFPAKPTLTSVIAQSNKIVKEKLDIWSPFGQKRMRPLDYWLEIVRIVNKKQYNISIKKLAITTQERGWEKEPDGTIKKDAGIAKVEVEGLFKSKTGEHFGEWGSIQNRFKDSALLRVIEPIDETPSDGVLFTIRMISKNV